MKWAVPSVDICTTLTLILAQYNINWTSATMSIWQLTAWKKNINLVEITQTAFITVQTKPFAGEPRSCPIDIFCRFHWIPVSGSGSDYKEIGLQFGKHHCCCCCSWCRFLTNCGMETWCSLRSLKEAGSGRREGKLKPKLIEICLLIKSCIPTILVLVFPSRAPRRSYSTAGENNQRSSQRPALCLFFLPNNN